MNKNEEQQFSVISASINIIRTIDLGTRLSGLAKKTKTKRCTGTLLVIAAFDTDSGPRPPEIMSDHQNIQTQWSDGPPKFSALSKIVTWPKNLSNRRHSRPIIQETQYRSRPFSRDKTSVYNHAGHELLRSRLTIHSRPFYGTKDMCS